MVTPASTHHRAIVEPLGVTPWSATELFRRISGDDEPAALLEMDEEQEPGRYAALVWQPRWVFRFTDGRGTIDAHGVSASVAFTDPLDVLRERTAAMGMADVKPFPCFCGGLVGYLSYDCIRYFERVAVPGADAPAEVPDGVWWFADRVLVLDKVTAELYLVALAAASEDLDLPSEKAAVLERLERHQPSTSVTKCPGQDAFPQQRSFREGVRVAQEAIRAGEIFQVVLSQKAHIEGTTDPVDLYDALRAVNPSPYMFLYRYGDFSVVGASPEVLARVEDRRITVCPIAGTRPRGVTLEDDLALERDLLADEKELAEHRMLVDLGRNDVGRVSKPGTVEVQRPLHIERFSHVMHIVTDVHGHLRDEHDAFDALRAAFPAGTVSGAPKIRAMQIIAELEPTRRGVYSGATGYVDAWNNLNTAIAIRTAVVRSHQVELQAGAGIVMDSVTAREDQECRNKMGAVLAALRTQSCAR